jgi:hypothetical protein
MLIKRYIQPTTAKGWLAFFKSMSICGHRGCGVHNGFPHSVFDDWRVSLPSPRGVIAQDLSKQTYGWSLGKMFYFLKLPGTKVFGS